MKYDNSSISDVAARRTKNRHTRISPGMAALKSVYQYTPLTCDCFVPSQLCLFTDLHTLLCGPCTVKLGASYGLIGPDSYVIGLILCKPG